MIKVDNTLYAGKTKSSDYSGPTGYNIIRVNDGANLGPVYTLQDGEDPRLFIEVEDGLDSNHFNYFKVGNSIYAGITTNEAAQLCDRGLITYTGKKFIRIHDGFDMGCKIVLGIDYSYDINQPRTDLPKYYLEIEDRGEEEQETDYETIG